MNKYTVIVDVDGSAKPNPGFYGTGIHGYMFNENNLNKKTNDKPDKYTITDLGYIETDQLLKHNYKLVNPEYYIDGYFSYGNVGTNNIAELNGFIELCNNLLNSDFEIEKIIIKTDSLYMMSVIRDVAKDKNWQQQLNKPNLSYLYIIEDVINKLKEKNIEYRLEKVEGHSGYIGNHIADRLSVSGRNISSRFKDANNFIITPNKKYWTNKLQRHPFLSFRQLFFTNNMRTAESENLYAIMNYKKDSEPGRKTHEACFGIVILQNTDEYIENVINSYQKNLRTMSILSTVDMDMLYSSYVSNYLNMFGTDLLTFDNKRNILSLMEEQELVSEVRPSGLGNQALDKMLSLYNIIKEYKDVGVSRDYIDISSYFYGINEKNKRQVLVPNGINEVTINLDYNGYKSKLILELGKDTLTRNVFKRMENDNINVILVVKKIKPQYLNYYVIIENTDSGDISIWHNFFTNHILIKPA